jgi:hypothetical protein
MKMRSIGINRKYSSLDKINNVEQQRYVESFNGKMRDELLNGEIINALLEVQMVIENWRRDYNHSRPTALWLIGRRLRKPKNSIFGLDQILGEAPYEEAKA